MKLTEAQETELYRAGGLLVRNLAAGYMDDGLSFEPAKEKATAIFEGRRETWINECVRPVAERHGIPVMNLLSLMFCDHHTDGPGWRQLHGSIYGGTADEFAAFTMHKAGYKAYAPIGIHKAA